MRTPVTLVLIGTAIAITAFAAWTFSPFADVGLGLNVNQSAQILMALGTIGLGFYIAAKSAFPLPLRRAWGLIALGSLSSVTGSILGTYSLLTQGTIPFPSLADAFYLPAYPLILAGILLLPYAPTRQEQRFLLNIDLSIVVLVCSAFLWYFVVADLIETGAGGLPGLISIAYPLGDLLILIGTVSLIQRDVQGMGRAILLAVSSGLLFFILADVMYAILIAQAVDFLNPLWPINGLLFLAARWGFLAATLWQATASQSAAKQTGHFSPLLRTNLAYLAVWSGMGLAFTALFGLFRLNLRLSGTLVGSFGITLLVLLRQYHILQDNRRLYREIERLAITDALTGLFNRRFFDEALAREIARAQRYRNELSLLLLDVNKFKQYNDRYGHPQGDRLLMDYARLIKSQLRSSDVAARYGGDEFAVILPETNMEMCRMVVDRLRQAVAERLTSESGTSISIGGATFKPDMTAATLLELADQAMYREKPRNAAR